MDWLFVSALLAIVAVVGLLVRPIMAAMRHLETLATRALASEKTWDSTKELTGEVTSEGMVPCSDLDAFEAEERARELMVAKLTGENTDEPYGLAGLRAKLGKVVKLDN